MSRAIGPLVHVDDQLGTDMSRNRNHKCRGSGRAAPPAGTAHIREAGLPLGMVLSINPFRWGDGGRQVICHLTCEMTAAKVVEIGVGLAGDAERQTGGALWAVQHGDPALCPTPSRVRELVLLLNAWSLPHRLGRWLRVWPPDGCPDEHAVAFWDSHRRPVASPGDDLRCTCGLPVTVTATDVVCASGHPIDAAV